MEAMEAQTVPTTDDAEADLADGVLRFYKLAKKGRFAVPPVPALVSTKPIVARVSNDSRPASAKARSDVALTPGF